MNGYLRFLKSLSQYQQRAEIGRLAFTERWGGSSLEEDLLQDPAVITYSKSLGVNPSHSWLAATGIDSEVRVSAIGI